MIKSMIAAGIVLACGVATQADYLSDRNTAMELVMFTKMAEGQVADFQKSDALGQAYDRIGDGQSAERKACHATLSGRLVG